VTSLCRFLSTPLLPLVGQKFAQANRKLATAMMSSCIIAAQLIMLPVALTGGRTADCIGRKPILLTGFSVLPIPPLLDTFSDSASWLIGVNFLDWVETGVFGAIRPW
jgi:MFS family permease